MHVMVEFLHPPSEETISKVSTCFSSNGWFVARQVFSMEFMHYLFFESNSDDAVIPDLSGYDVKLRML